MEFREEWRAPLLRFGTHVLIGIVVGYALGLLFPASILDTVGAFVTVIALQRRVIKAVVVDNVVGEAFVRLLSGGGVPPVPEFSRAESLAARGDILHARAAYEEAIRGNRKDPRAYIGLAHMLRLHARDYRAAAFATERALKHAKLDKATRSILERELSELNDLINSEYKEWNTEQSAL